MEHGFLYFIGFNLYLALVASDLALTQSQLF